jgi:hypothetical protein
LQEQRFITNLYDTGYSGGDMESMLTEGLAGVDTLIHRFGSIFIGRALNELDIESGPHVYLLAI